jgi:sortase B
MDMKRKTRRNRAIAWFLLAASLCVMAVAGYSLREPWQAYRESKDAYGELASQVRPGGPPDVPEAAVEIPDMPIDFGGLQTVNPDAAAWLYSPGTVIDYPVMRATDYNYYLRHLPDGTYNVNGTLFIDYNNAPDFTDKLTVIYGHHMRSGAMFGSLKGYKGQDYFEKHPCMYLYTQQGNYRIDLLYGCVIGMNEWRERAFMYEANLDALLGYATSHTTFTSSAQYIPGDRIVAMSTCSYEFDGARYVVLGVLRAEWSGEI